MNARFQRLPIFAKPTFPIMPGPIEINASEIKPLSDIAYKDAQGKWRAGPEAKDEYVDAGGNIQPAYAKQARGIRKRTNMIKSIMRGQDIDEATARENANTILEKLREIDADMDPQERKKRRREIWQTYGS